MKGKLFIDGRDAFIEYGIWVEQGGYKGLIQRASFKKLDSTDWPDEDGEEIDLESPVLDTRSFSIPFCISNVRYAEDLFFDLSGGAYHDFDFIELGKTYRLRMTSNGSFKKNIKLGKLTLTFSDDFPVIPEAEPYILGKTEIRQNGYEIDGIDLSQFGSYALKDSDDNIRKAANIKEALKLNNKTLSGIIYDADNVVFKSKDVSLKLLIDAPNIEEFWRRYDALFAVLFKSKTRTFYYTALDAEYECYYKNSSVSKFDILRSGKVWCEFSVTLTFISYRPVGQYMYLATEDFDYVITEIEEAKVIIRPKFGISLIIAEDGSYIVTEPGEDKIFINTQN